MSISMEHIASIGPLLASRATLRLQRQAFPYRLQCRACGFEPADAIVSPTRCPKCLGGSWERFVLPGSLLLRVDGDHLDFLASDLATRILPNERPGACRKGAPGITGRVFR